MFFTQDQQSEIEEIQAEFNSKFNFTENVSGRGARFWVHISELNDTAEYVSDWKVTIRHHYENWQGIIDSADPHKILQTPSLSGIFHVSVKARIGDETELRELEPHAGSNWNIGCNSNCAAMIGIVAAPSGEDAGYWTIWDAYNTADENS